MNVAVIALLVLVPANTDARVRALEEKVAEMQKRIEALETAKPEPAIERQEKAYDIVVGDSPTIGPKNAPITVTLFFDYQCPFSARLFPWMMAFLKDDELKGHVRIVFKHFPLSFHKNAQRAAQSSIAVRALGGDEAFWRYSEILFDNSRELDDPSSYASAVSVAPEKVDAWIVLNREAADAQIHNDSRTGARDLKVRGTPSVFVNGWELRARTAEGLKALLREKNLAKGILSERL